MADAENWPPFDPAQARAFLSALDPTTPWFILQFFTDAAAKPTPDPLARVSNPVALPPEQPFVRLTPGAGVWPSVLDCYARGAGVWVTVNRSEGGRREADITAVRAIWQEDDSGYEGSFPLEPSIINETSPGHFHRYWLGADDWPADDIGTRDFRGVMARMVRDYASDPSCTDINRVLRVPGFLHRKNPAEPFMVQRVGGNGLRYRRTEILAAFPPLLTSAPANGAASPHAGTGEQRAELVRRIVSGETYHGPLRDLAFRDTGAGQPAGQVIESLRGLMLGSRGERDARWHSRFDSIPRLVESAGNKQAGRPAREAQPDPPPPAAPLVVRSMWDALKAEPPPRCWHIEHWCPGNDTTGLFGDGGEGKTQLGLQLAFCTATGMPWLGMNVRSGAAVCLLAEEPEPEIDFRGHQLAKGIIVPDEAHRHPFETISRAEHDALLCRVGRSGIVEPTPLFDELVQLVGDLKAVLLVIDAAADVYGGDENDRPQVRAFIAMLRRLAIGHRCAVLLMGHPSRDGMRSGLGYSGSTSWHNSLRARWYFTTPKILDGAEPDGDLRELSLEKTNRGRRGQRISLRWRDGWFSVEHGEASALKIAEAKTKFIELLATYTRQGRYVSAKPKANNYAPTVFAADRNGKRLGKALFAAAMDALFSELRLAVVMGPPDVRPAKQREILVAQ